MKCEICGKKLTETYLGKFLGTHIKKQGKKHSICFECQKLPKETILEKI